MIKAANTVAPMLSLHTLSSDLALAKHWLNLPAADRLTYLKTLTPNCPHELIASDTSLSARAYETYIHEQHKIPTRLHTAHDFFNALIWHRFPKSKALLNASHVSDTVLNIRSRLRDGLTLLDESGVLLWAPASTLETLQALHQQHRWSELCVAHRDLWHSNVEVHFFGHGALHTCAQGGHPLFTLKALWLPKKSTHPDEDLHTWLSEHADAQLPTYFLPLPYLALSELSGPPTASVYQDKLIFRPKSNKKICL
ncbi:MAG: hypothetical protein RLZZ502_799 [Pseudomonadota bacterium]